MKIPSDFNPDERAARAEEYFRQGYNCCQSVVLAFSDIVDVPEDMLKVITSGFGGGMGRMREVCGAFSGCVFMAGVISPADNPSDMTARSGNYALVQEFAAEFKKRGGGSIICRELLGLGQAEAKAESPTPSDRTAVYYRKRPCAKTVAAAARIVAEKIKSVF